MSPQKQEEKIKTKTTVITKLLIGIAVVIIVAVGVGALLSFFGILSLKPLEFRLREEQPEIEALPPEVTMQPEQPTVEVEIKQPEVTMQPEQPEIEALPPEVTLTPMETGTEPSEVPGITMPPLGTISETPTAELAEAEREIPEISREPELLIDPKIIYRGHNRVIIMWTVSDPYKDKPLKFKYGEKTSEINKEAKVYKSGDKHYVVLRNLKGGEVYEKNDAGYKDGRFKYYLKAEAEGKTSNVAEFKTLNRFQTILYYYTLLFGDSFDIEANAKPKADLRGGGPYFFYKPEGKEPPTLPGIKFTMMNDKAFQEFDRRLEETAKVSGNQKAIELLYQKVFDRIYDDNLEKYFDEAGVSYWKSQVERTDIHKISLLGIKFALSTSSEYNEELKTILPEADVKANLAYQIVLKRGAETSGLAFLKNKYSLSKDMRKELASSLEYNERIAKIEREQGRKPAIEELYETLYARAADIAGADFWDRSGKSINQIRNEFLGSDEFIKVLKE
jgi:hypothetical protein